MKNKLLMPFELTAENGAKYAMIGEFKESIELRNPEFCGCGECHFCFDFPDEPEYLVIEVPVSWSTIKSIYERLVEKLQQPLAGSFFR